MGKEEDEEEITKETWMDPNMPQIDCDMMPQHYNVIQYLILLISD